jgi:hypothetical protein
MSRLGGVAGHFVDDSDFPGDFERLNKNKILWKLWGTL